MIGAAEVLEAAVRQPAGEIAGAVEALTRAAPGGERVWYEALGGLCRQPQVAEGEARAADADLAGHPDRHRRSGRPGGEVQQEDLAAVERGAETQPLLAGVDRHRGADRHLRRPVSVDQTPPCRPPPRQLDRAGLSRHRQRAQVRQDRRGGLRREGQSGEKRGGEGRHRDSPLVQEGEQLRAGKALEARGEDQGRAGAQSHRDLRHRGVEARRGELQHAALRPDREEARLRRGESVEAAVGHQHPLGPAGGPRGVDDVGQIVRTGAGVQRSHFFALDGAAVGVQPHHRHAGEEVGRQSRGRGLLGDQEVDPAVGEQPGQALRRVGRIERKVGRARLEDAEQAGQHLR